MGSVETGGNSPLAPSKTPEPMVTKLGVSDDVEDSYHCAKFHHDPIRHFCSPPRRASARASAYKVTRLVNFLGSSSSPQPRPLHWPLRSIRQMTSFCAGMCLPKTKFYISTLISPKTANFGQILTGQKFSAQKALTMGMVIYKVPLIVIVALWKLYSDEANRGQGI